MLLYKHRSTPGKLFTLAMIYFDDFVTVTFSQRGGESSHWEFRFADYLITPWNEQTAISDMYQNLDVSPFPLFNMNIILIYGCCRTYNLICRVLC